MLIKARHREAGWLGLRLICRAWVIGFIFVRGATEASAAQAWVLDPAQSIISYQSVKKNTIVETNTIRNLSGLIEADGTAIVSLDLNSVDTGVDIRNVRMRFLFFETFQYPTATVSAKLNPADFADLPSKRRMVVPLTARLSLHGVEKEIDAEVVVTMVTEKLVSVASKTPIAVKVEDFGLLPAIEKLERAANVTNIVPTASVSFDLMFAADAGSSTPAVQAAALQSTGPIATDASKSEYSLEECANRFDVLSKTGAVYFRSGSARLDPASRPVLDNVVDVVAKCPTLKVLVSGHTDADGSESENQQLSQRRAQSVREFIVGAGIGAERVAAVGHGEAQPIASNDTPKNKALNRRIEFAATAASN